MQSKQVQAVLSTAGDGSLLSYSRPSESLDLTHLRGLIDDMVVFDELSFEFVEKLGFKNVISYAVPTYRQMGRQTVRDDIVDVLYEDRIKAFKAFFPKCIDTENPGFSFTTDIYTCTAQKKAYMAVTVHFIMRHHGWTLYNTIIGFESLDSPHTGVNIANKFIKILKEYGLQNNAFSCTMDNAGNNDTFSYHMKHRQREAPLLLNGEFFQSRCNGHCYNLIAQDGLALLKEPLAGIFR